MEVLGVFLSYFMLFGYIYSSYCSEDLTFESASPLKGLDENNFFVKNVLFTSNGNKNLNIKFWLLHFQYDFGYFSDNIPNFLNDMEIYIDQSKETQLIAHNYGSATNIDVANLFSHILGTQLEAIELLYNQLTKLNNKILQVKNLIHHKGTRQTRAILPISGLFSALFGVVSESQIQSISDKIQNLEQKNEHINHFIDSSLTALNESYILIRENRHKIYDLEVYHEKIYRDLFNKSQDMNQYVGLNSQYISESTQNQRLITQAKQVLSDLQHDFDMAITQLGDLSLGKLPTSLVPPEKLRDTLQQISELLHTSLALPFDLENDLLLYYKNIFCTTARKPKGLSVACSIPITDSKRQLRFFKANAFPFPIKDANEVSAVAKVILDHQYVALTRDQTEIALLTKKDFEQCMSTPNNYCHLRSALTKIQFYKDSCVVNLLLDKKDSNNLCHISAKQYKIEKPIIQNIYKSNWQIIFNHEISWTLYCNNEPDRQITTQAPYDIVYVEKSCELVSRIATIIGGFGGSSSIDVRVDHIIPQISPHKFYANLFKNINATPIPPLKHLEKLPNEWVSLTKLHDMSSTLTSKDVKAWYEKNIFTWNWPSFLMIIIAIIIIFVVIELVYRGIIKSPIGFGCKFAKKSSNQTTGIESSQLDVRKGSQLLLDELDQPVEIENDQDNV